MPSRAVETLITDGSRIGEQVISIASPISFYNTQDDYRAFADKFPVTGPFLFVLLQIVQVVFAPISHFTVGFMGGFLYGQWLGALLNWIGRIIGHLIAFFLARRFGRKLVERFVDPETIAKYDKYVSNQYAFLFIAYFLPLFPDDEFSYLCGISKMRFRAFLLINLLGQIGGSLGLAQLGSGVDTSSASFWIMAVATTAALVALWPILRKMKTTENPQQ